MCSHSFIKTYRLPLLSLYITKLNWAQYHKLRSRAMGSNSTDVNSSYDLAGVYTSLGSDMTALDGKQFPPDNTTRYIHVCHW